MHQEIQTQPDGGLNVMFGRTEHLPWQESHGQRKVNFCSCCYSNDSLFFAPFLVFYCVQVKRKIGRMLVPWFVPLYLELLLGLLMVLGVVLHIQWVFIFSDLKRQTNVFYQPVLNGGRWHQSSFGHLFLKAFTPTVPTPVPRTDLWDSWYRVGPDKNRNMKYLFILLYLNSDSEKLLNSLHHVTHFWSISSRSVMSQKLLLCFLKLATLYKLTLT